MMSKNKDKGRPAPDTAAEPARDLAQDRPAKKTREKAPGKIEGKPDRKSKSEPEAAGSGESEEAAPVEREEASAVALSERLLRLQADFENYRRRVQREKEDMYRRANEDIMMELLPVLDHFEMALDSAPQDADHRPFVEGVRLVSSQLSQALRKYGLTPVDAEGAEFNPHEHEAVSHLPSAEVAENVVMAQTRRGYKLGERVLRAAQVVVSCGTPPKPQPDEAPTE